MTVYANKRASHSAKQKYVQSAFKRGKTDVRDRKKIGFASDWLRMWRENFYQSQSEV